MTKKLTATALKKLDNQLSSHKEILVYDNQFTVKINETFRESKIEAVTMTYMSILQELKARTEMDDLLIQGTIGLLSTLILREFTDLPIPQTNTIEELIKVSKVLLDTGIMKEVFDGMDKEELGKIEEKIKSINNEVGKIVGELVIASSVTNK